MSPILQIAEGNRDLRAGSTEDVWSQPIEKHLYVGNASRDANKDDGGLAPDVDLRREDVQEVVEEHVQVLAVHLRAPTIQQDDLQAADC